MFLRASLLAASLLLASVAPAQVLDAITFASRPKEVYVPVREVASRLEWRLEYDALVELVRLKGVTLSSFLPRLSDGTWLVSTAELAKMGANVSGSQVRDGSKSLTFRVGKKRVSVDLKSQTLTAMQGDRVVYRWAVSSGSEGKETPNGNFRALDKEPMHISKLYGSPMPFSVHVTGNIYIHGSNLFSSTPGSHGCIRLPVMEARNVAQEFFNWIEVGTPIQIRGAFPFHSNSQKGAPGVQ